MGENLSKQTRQASRQNKQWINCRDMEHKKNALNLSRLEIQAGLTDVIWRDDKIKKSTLGPKPIWSWISLSLFFRYHKLNHVLLPVFHLLDSLAVVVNPSYRKLVRNAYLFALAINLITCTGKQYLPQNLWMGYM